MAPPRHRDRGFSRRIQYGLFFGYVFAAAGIVAGVALLLIAKFEPVAFQGIRGLALDATAPLSAATRPIARGGRSFGEEIGDYFRAASQNAGLRRELAEARRGLIEAKRLEFENRRLKRLVRLVEPGAQAVATARLIGSDLAGDRRFATLLAGGADGVRAGQPVRAADGLVGRVAEAGRHAARVVLLTDGGTSVPLRVVRTGEPALALGRGDGTIEVRPTAAGLQHFRRGDLLVTSGVGGVYPPDLPVAVVTGIAGEVATARPLADPARLDFAIVLAEAAAPPPAPPPAQRPR